ncbi:MAG: transporter ATP-binding protein, partial [Bacteroidetes bacterium]|nr:transporter ATP-binding protein [Bacteroidota bacterium]
MEKKLLLEVKNLVTEFKTDDGPVKAVNDISFNLYRGETVG